MKSISVQNMNGSNEQITLVSSFNIPDINKNFAILSKGESVGEGTAKVYIAEIFETGGEYKFIGIIDEVIWDKVKQSMKSLVQGVSVPKFRFNSVGPSILEGYRIIGLKNSDLENISKNSEEEEAPVEQTIDETVTEEVVSPSVEEPVSSVEENYLDTNLYNEVPETNMEINNDVAPVNYESVSESQVESDYVQPVETENNLLENNHYEEETNNFSVGMSNLDRFDKFLLETQQILEETREKINDLLDEYDRKIMDLSTSYIDEVEDKLEKTEIENNAYRKAIGNVINNIKISE